jgi:hypothetical protein
VEEVGRFVREPFGAQRIRRAGLGVGERSPDDPFECARLAERDEPAECAFGVGDRSVDEDAAARVGFSSGVDAFGQAGCVVAALERDGADE